MTELRVLVLCFSYFTDNSIMSPHFCTQKKKAVKNVTKISHHHVTGSKSKELVKEAVPTLAKIP